MGNRSELQQAQTPDVKRSTPIAVAAIIGRPSPDPSSSSFLVGSRLSSWLPIVDAMTPFLLRESPLGGEKLHGHKIYFWNSSTFNIQQSPPNHHRAPANQPLLQLVSHCVAVSLCNTNSTPSLNCPSPTPPDTSVSFNRRRLTETGPASPSAAPQKASGRINADRVGLSLRHSVSAPLLPCSPISLSPAQQYGYTSSETPHDQPAPSDRPSRCHRVDDMPGLSAEASRLTHNHASSFKRYCVAGTAPEATHGPQAPRSGTGSTSQLARRGRPSRLVSGLFPAWR